MMKIIDITLIMTGIFFILNRDMILRYYINIAAKNNKIIRGKNKELIPVIFGLILIIKGLIGLISFL